MPVHKRVISSLKEKPLLPKKSTNKPILRSLVSIRNRSRFHQDFPDCKDRYANNSPVNRWQSKMML